MNLNDLLLKEKLKSKEAKLFHAINFRDFVEYCRQRSILARSVLADSFGDYTRFFSDEVDKELGVWERTFGNLNDFGRYFWQFEAATPNAYGPITIVLGRQFWDGLSDIKITKRTITADENELLSAAQIDDAYEYVDGVYRLRAGFTATEVSASNPRISLEYLAYILVDPLIVAGKPLREHVLAALEETACLGEVATAKQVIERRVYCDPQEARIEHLLAWSRTLGGRLIDANEPLQNTLPPELAEWFDSLEEWKQRILASWLTYTFNGTLRWLE